MEPKCIDFKKSKRKKKRSRAKSKKRRQIAKNSRKINRRV